MATIKTLRFCQDKYMIHYQIKVPVDPSPFIRSHYDIIPAKPVQVFSLPAWLPGSYMVRDFAKISLNSKAQDANGQTLKLIQLDKQTWSVDNNNPRSEIILTYQVYAWGSVGAYCAFGHNHGFFNGSSVFLSAHGFEQQTHTVTMLPPSEPWINIKVTGALLPAWPASVVTTFYFGQFSATSYDELIDHPVEMGLFTLASFDACGVHARYRTQWPPPRLHAKALPRLKTICEYQINLFGTPAPFKRYLFYDHSIRQWLWRVRAQSFYRIDVFTQGLCRCRSMRQLITTIALIYPCAATSISTAGTWSGLSRVLFTL